MRYINRINGAVIETECEITGDLWEAEASPVVKDDQEEEATPKKGKAKK